jgi:hypothetical protein
MWRVTSLLILFVVLGGTLARAAGGPVSLHGKIDRDMAFQVAAATERGVRDFTIESRGGYVLFSGIIAGIINAAGGSLTVVGECASACSLMLMGVKRRFVAAGGYVEMHSSNKGGISNLYRRYGVPAEIARHGDDLNVHRLTVPELAAAGVQGR